MKFTEIFLTNVLYYYNMTLMETKEICLRITKEVFMNPDFYTQRTKRLLQSGYPVEVSTIDCTLSDEPHCHDEIEFQYVMKGHACITCGEDNLLASEGDIIFVNQSVKHIITPVGNDKVVFCCAAIHPSFILGFGQLELEAKYVNPILSDSSFRYLHITFDNCLYQQFLSPLEQLIQLNNIHTDGYELLSKVCILQLWKLIYDLLPTKSSVPSGITANQDEQRVRQIMLYIQEHFMEPLTLDDIAGSILISRSECCRCFKRTTGLSPFEYLMRYRITESTKRMHRRTHESISEIACAVGFNNTSYYNKVFKKFMNCTPSEYQRSLNKEC